MIKFNPKKILIPVDFSDTSMNAVNHAAFLAERMKADIHLLHLMKDLSDHKDVIKNGAEMKRLKSAAESIAEKRMSTLLKRIQKDFGILATTAVSTGNIPRQIVKVAKAIKADFIVMGTHGYSPMAEFVLGSNALTVLQLAKCPVMTVRERTNHMYSRIILPIDLSEHSRQKVNAAIQVARKYGAAMHVIGILGPGEKADKNKLQLMLEQIKKLCIKGGLLAKTEVILASKNRSYSTLQYCKKVKGDLIMIMSDQETEFSGLLLGPYANQVINHAHSPVICFKPEVHPERMSWTDVGSYN